MEKIEKKENFENNLKLASKIFVDDRTKLQKILDKGQRYLLAPETLKILAAVGFITLPFLMPGLAVSLGKIAINLQRQAFRQRLNRLKKRKLINIRYEKDEPVVEITQNGLKEALRFKVQEMTIKKPPRWDKKWRLIIFDIVEKKKRQRDQFRSKLQELGFYPLNESVYVHAFPCFEEVEFIRQIYFVGGEVKYILAEKIENGELLKSRFGLE